jgi:pyrroline-5-carboxylate reductase
MGGALIKGWLAGHTFSSVHVIEPIPSEELRALAAEGAIHLHSSFDAAELPPLTASVLAIKPQVLKTDARLLRELGGRGALVVSIAAGIGTAFLKQALGAGVPVVRAMPNLPGAIGQGITVLFAGMDVAHEDRALAERIAAALGKTLWLTDENLMDAVTAISGSGPAYVFLFAEALTAAGIAQGLDRATAEKLARATVAGAGHLLDTDSRDAALLRKDVTSPGGTTEAALNVLMAGEAMEGLLRRAVDAATKRGKDLGKV